MTDTIQPRRDVDAVVDTLVRTFGNQPEVIQEYLLNPARLLNRFCTMHDYVTNPDATLAVRRWATESLSPPPRPGHTPGNGAVHRFRRPN